MKKITIVSLASFLFLFVSSLVAILTRYVFKSAETALMVGVIVLIASAVFSLCTDEKIKLNLLCFAASSVAMGVLLRAWYIVREFDNTFLTMLAVSFSVVLYLWTFFALSRIPLFRKSHLAYGIFCVCFIALSATLYFIIMANTKTTYVSTFGYYMIVELGFILAMSFRADSPEELMKNLTHSTYSIFVVAIIIAVFVIIAATAGDCDCDCGSCDGCDCGGGSGGSRKENKSVEIDLN